jgi:outer membrane cobalamin receptor
MNQPAALAKAGNAEAPVSSSAVSGSSAELKEAVVTAPAGACSLRSRSGGLSPWAVDPIVAHDIGKLPVPNLADSLQRVPGIQLYRHAREGWRALTREPPMLDVFQAIRSQTALT